MKILHIITSLELGGAEKLITDLIPLQKRNAQVDVLILYDKENVFQLDTKVSKYNSKSTYKNIFEILKIIKDGKYDIVHTHLTHAQIWTSIASLFDFSKTKYITTEHSTSNNRRGKKIFKYLDKFIFSRYSRIICISEAVKNSLMEWIEDKREFKYSVISNGINLKNFRNAEEIDRKIFNFSVEDKILIMVSRLNPAKDHETLLKAIKNLPEKYRLLIVGEGVKEKELRDKVVELKIENRVSFLGMRNDIPSLLKMSDIAIQSSHFEGFGITAVEAMASGLPLIASDVPGLRDVVEGAGILFEKGNDIELVQKIVELEDEDFKKEIIKKQKERSEKYSLEVTCKEYIKSYEEVLK